MVLSRKRSQAGLDTVPPTPRKTLIRRLYLDLIGLPPTQTIERQTPPAPDDGLLTSPQHGEQWAGIGWTFGGWRLVWLGKQLRNSQKHLWHWRDWSSNPSTTTKVMTA